MNIRLETFTVIPCSYFGRCDPACVDIELRVNIQGIVYGAKQVGVPLTAVKSVLANIRRDIAHTYTASISAKIGELI